MLGLYRRVLPCPAQFGNFNIHTRPHKQPSDQEIKHFDALESPLAFFCPNSSATHHFCHYRFILLSVLELYTNCKYSLLLTTSFILVMHAAGWICDSSFLLMCSMILCEWNTLQCTYPEYYWQTFHCFQLLAIFNKASMSIFVNFFVDICIHFSWTFNKELSRLGHWVGLVETASLPDWLCKLAFPLAMRLTQTIYWNGRRFPLAPLLQIR